MAAIFKKLTNSYFLEPTTEVTEVTAEQTSLETTELTTGNQLKLIVYFVQPLNNLNYQCTGLLINQNIVDLTTEVTTELTSELTSIASTDFTTGKNYYQLHIHFSEC